MPQATPTAVPIRTALKLPALAMLLALFPQSASAEDPPAPGQVKSWTEATQDALRGSSIAPTVGYVQGTFKANKTGFGESQITDNGQFNVSLDYSGRERALVRAPMVVGTFILGWNLTGSLGQFQANRQLLTSAFTGTNVGTSMKGEYAAVAPSVFIRLGPLYPGRAIFWSFGVGLGAGVTKYDGTAQFGGAPGTQLAVSSGGLRPTLYETAFWRLDIGHWMVLFNGKYLLIRDPNLVSTSYESYGLNLGYRITF